MATQTLSPAPVPTFPQLIDVLDAAEMRLPQPLGECCWHEYDCQKSAIVHHVQTELEFCLQHFRQWEREGWELGL